MLAALVCLRKELRSPGTLSDLQTSAPLASRPEANLVASSPPRTARGPLPGQPDSGLGEGCSKEKRRRRGEEDGALAPAAARHLPRGLVLPAPSARGTGVGDGGARGPRVLSAAGDGQKESEVGAHGRRARRAPPQARGGGGGVGGSRLHHADERHGLRAGGLGYPDAAQVLCRGPGLGAEVAVADLLLDQVLQPVVHL